MARAIAPVLVGVLVWTALAWGQRPSEAEATALVEKSRDRALAYARSLPDFVCTEVVRRFSEAKPHMAWGVTPVPAARSWTPLDKLTIRLSFFQLSEEHKLILLNGKPTDQTYDSLAGGTTAGEFGGTLYNIFDRDAQTAFQWESWKTVRHHPVAVYRYSVEAAHSHYMVANAAVDDTYRAIVKFHGSVDVDRETGEVLHLTYVADQIPNEVGVDKVSTTVDYDFADVAGRSYLLPSRSETEILSPGLAVMNQMEFRDYRKFSVDSTIEFGKVK